MMPPLDDAFLDHMAAIQQEKEPDGFIEPLTETDETQTYSFGLLEPTAGQSELMEQDSYDASEKDVANYELLYDTTRATQVITPTDDDAFVAVCPAELFHNEFPHLSAPDVDHIINTGDYFVLQKRPRGIVKNMWETARLVSRNRKPLAGRDPTVD